DVVTGLNTNSGWFKGVHSVIRELCSAGSISLQELMQLDRAAIDELFSKIDIGTEDDWKRVRIILRLHWLLYEKYSVSTRDILHALKRSNFTSIAQRKQLEEHLNSGQKDKALEIILTIMTDLKSIILDPTPSESWENIYYKRHIAVGIPSMYGQYHEKKYEALGLSLRLEYTADRLMEELIDDIIFSYTSLKNLKKTAMILEYFLKGLEIRGIYNQNFESNVHMLQYSLSSESFSINQYINIFQFFIRNTRAIIDQYFISVYDKPLKQILRKKWESLPSDVEIMKKVTQESESFFRDMLASSFFIQNLDRFLSQILRNLREMRDTIPKNLIHRAMSYDPDLLASPLYESMTRTDNKIFLGAKAYFLKKLISFGFPIPEGFILTTELFRHSNVILMHPQMEKEVDEIIRDQIRKLEERTGCVYGDPDKPLFLSVRSGSAFSMPGAMNTFLNVGMNRDTAKALGRNPKYAWAAWDCYRRLLQSWGMSYGIQRDEFDLIMKEMKQKHGVEKKRQFTPRQMEALSDHYATLLARHGISFETDLFLQLKQAVLAVIDSWFSNRAKVYRKLLQIADEWGTAVLIQRMMFGNLNDNSGTGVVFTKSPFGDDHIRLYGDYIPCSQGEDIVSGLVHTLPIKDSDDHKNGDFREETLEKRYPVIYRKLEEYASILIEEHDFPHQEIEFTFESPDDLYILQTRAQSVSKQHSIEIFDTTRTSSPPLGRGIGVGSGVLNGIAAFTLEDILQFRKDYPAEKCILLRPDTVPDDIEMVFACDGLLTARGGVTSHAAVTAAQLGKVCVVNCRELMVNEAGKTAELNGTCFNLGDKIALDGFNGSIYSGNLPICTRDGELIS
ncbi:MAG: PEP/pyruvate-binding domain-containing protein, partial [Spirochaetota bacterium]|nr:PEP/pyruvate-binding domain-containing protein [Spirochaetota bacterium]